MSSSSSSSSSFSSQRQELERIRDDLWLGYANLDTVWGDIRKAIPREIWVSSATIFNLFPGATANEFGPIVVIGSIDFILFQMEARDLKLCAILVFAKLPLRYHDVFRAVYREYLPLRWGRTKSQNGNGHSL